MRIKSDKCDREGRYYRQTSSLGVWKIYAMDINEFAKNEKICDDSFEYMRFAKTILIQA